MPTQALFETAEHRNILLEDFTSGKMVQANQHLIIHKNEAILLDPGGHKVYSSILEELSTVVPLGWLKHIFFSHQDPDIVAAANGWLMTTDATGYIPTPWIRFITHFGVDDLLVEKIHPIPDAGMKIDLAGCPLLVIPAHFLHSPANFQVYDPVSKILYTGDLGASLGQTYTIVSNFDDHVQYMIGFHRRYIASSKALKLWANMVRQLDIEAIAPQHGAMMMGKAHVERFIDWIANLTCGLDLMESVYKVPS
ncbi:MAG: FprA family A-type flavoprotein [Anaerolineae bacterium]|nr:FprA family A-type flavoprotein [Anaerolineae bacterium]